MTEQEIISQCKIGKFEYFWELYEKYVDQIYRFVYLKTYDSDVSEDITSQTFFKAIDKISTFKNDETSNFRAWLYRIAYNLVVDTYKKDTAHISSQEILEIGYSQDFEKNIENKQKIEEILAYLDTLKPSHKQILIMRFWDDLSYKEISEVTWESLANCKKVVSRTLQNIPSSLYNILIILLLIL